MIDHKEDWAETVVEAEGSDPSLQQLAGCCSTSLSAYRLSNRDGRGLEDHSITSQCLTTERLLPSSCESKAKAWAIERLHAACAVRRRTPVTCQSLASHQPVTYNCSCSELPSQETRQDGTSSDDFQRHAAAQDAGQGISIMRSSRECSLSRPQIDRDR